jgi:hypothetical protein
MNGKKLLSLNARIMYWKNIEPITFYQQGMKRADVRRAQKAWLKIRLRERRAG